MALNLDTETISSPDQKARMRDDAERFSHICSVEASKIALMRQYARDVQRLLNEIKKLEARLCQLEKDKLTLLNRANQTDELKEILGTKDIRNQRPRITDNRNEENNS